MCVQSEKEEVALQAEGNFFSHSLLLLFTMAYCSGRSTLVPGAYFHISLQQGTRNDEVLDFLILMILRAYKP
jgi:hypothetical protein